MHLTVQKNVIKTDKPKTISSSPHAAERHEICALCYYGSELYVNNLPAMSNG